MGYVPWQSARMAAHPIVMHLSPVLTFDVRGPLAGRDRDGGVRRRAMGGHAAVSLLRLELVVAAAIVVFVGGAPAQPKTDGGWSADLLNRILKVEPGNSDAPSAARAVPEMVLHTYRLAHLRVGEAGKSQNVLAILEKLLPPGSSMKTDVPANSLHVLTTAAAHQAVWDYLSAVDLVEPAAPTTGAVVPDEVKAALKKLADAGEQSGKLLAAVGALRSDLSAELGEIEIRQRQQTLRLILAGGAFAVVFVGTIAWMVRRRTPATPAVAPDSTALVVAPEQLTMALTPVHDKMRNDMLGLLNEVAIKLQAQHNEQQKLVREQQQQLEDARLALAEERRQFITEAGSMVVQAVERVDATTAKLAKQQDKVAELVQELQHTVRELDETKDNLRDKEVELEQERAKIAALSILLEDGGAPPLNGRMAEPNGHERTPLPAARFHPATISTCMNPDPTGATTPTRVDPPTATAPEPTWPVRFQFLPPDHPES